MTIHDKKKTMESTKREVQLRLKKCYRSVTFLYWQFTEQAEEMSSLELHSCCARDLTKVGDTRFYRESKVFVN